MPNVRLIVEYDGRHFHGWQSQPGVITVQDELSRVIKVVLRTEIGALHAAGRTDAGVHALGQVVTFRCDEAPDLGRLAIAVSHLLKGKLAVRRAELVPGDFHPGRCATAKQYRYVITNRKVSPTIDRGRVWHVPRPLNRERMAVEAATLVGVHDFTSFRGADCTARSTEKRIMKSEWSFDGEEIEYRVVGSGFLKHMVRNLVGTMVDQGTGRIKASIVEILAAKNRRSAGQTAPAWGLFMDWVRYDPEPECNSSWFAGY